MAFLPTDRLQAASLQPRQLSPPMFWGVLTAFVAAGLGAAVLISRGRR